MFPRIAKSEKKSGTYEYLVISESIHVRGKGSTTRNIANLGNVKRFDEKAINSLIDGLIRLFNVEKYALSEGVEIIETLEHGSIILWRKFWNELGFTEAVRKLIRRKESRIKLEAEKYIEMMVVNRCVDPLSKLGAARWIERTCYKSMKGYHQLPLEVEYFYRSMDYLLKIKDELETYLFEKMMNLFSINVKLTFYDITSSFFYSESCPISKYGYSRDKRPDKVQIIIGVVTSYEGYPIKHYVFEGNTKDETTVLEVVKQLKETYHIEQTTFVGDRGMITRLNLDSIVKGGFDYIMGVKHHQSQLHTILFDDGGLEEKDWRTYKELKIQDKEIAVKDFLMWKIRKILQAHETAVTEKAFEEISQMITALNNGDSLENSGCKTVLEKITSDNKIRGKIYALIKKYEGRYDDRLRTIVCLNSERKAVSKKARDEKLNVLSQELDKVFAADNELVDAVEIEKKLANVFDGHNGRYEKYFPITRQAEDQKATGYSLNQDVIAYEEKLDGIFILSTNKHDLDAEKVVDSYKNLNEIETLFDDLKNFVDIRPIRHWLEVRVRAHVFICILALLLKRIFEINYMGNKTLMEPLEEISKSQLVRYKIKFSEREDRTASFLKVTTLTDAQKKYFKLAGISNPVSLENFVW